MRNRILSITYIISHDWVKNSKKDAEKRNSGRRTDVLDDGFVNQYKENRYEKNKYLEELKSKGDNILYISKLREATKTLFN